MDINALTKNDGKTMNFDTTFYWNKDFFGDIRLNININISWQQKKRLNINSRFCQGLNAIDFVKIIVQLRPFIYKGSKKEIYLRCEWIIKWRTDRNSKIFRQFDFKFKWFLRIIVISSFFCYRIHYDRF